MGRRKTVRQCISMIYDVPMASPLQPAQASTTAIRTAIRRLGMPLPSALSPQIRLYQVPGAVAAWQGVGEPVAGLGARCPFWAEIWPGGEAMARFLLDAPDTVSARVVYDLGAGCGVGAIAAARAGAARARAVDCDLAAVTAVSLNATLNAVTVASELADPLDGPLPEGVDVILAADLWYEPWLARRTTAWLRRAAKAGITVLVADPGRAHLPRSGLVELACYPVPTSLDTERAALTPTRVFRIDRDARI